MLYIWLMHIKHFKDLDCFHYEPKQVISQFLLFVANFLILGKVLNKKLQALCTECSLKYNEHILFDFYLDNHPRIGMPQTFKLH